MRIHIENIGCFKNLVDSERLYHALEVAGFSVTFGSFVQDADIAIINTCGFIGDAEEDSEALIKQYEKRKKKGQISQLWVMGCYGQKYGESLKHRNPTIDRIFGNFDWKNILHILGCDFYAGIQRHVTTPPHYAYLKISEGCNRPCAYCIKPILNGKLASVSMETILEEVRWMVSQGVRELQIVAQNLTDYGLDIYGENKIAELVDRIANVPGVDWIRLHYAYPLGFPKDLLKVIREHDNVCNYLDMALQHCNTEMLKRMRRGGSKEYITDLLAEIRESVPGIYLRTTMLTGFPGETVDMFDELCEFVKEQKFERMGVFRYSAQKGSYSAKHYTDDIPDDEKTRRALYLMDIQNQYYRRLHLSLLETVHRVIVDECVDGKYYCRTEHSTPMADPKVIVESDKSLSIGSFYQVQFTEVLGKDIVGKVI
ncbi:MAG: MiaB/RimO family radical SAM methylthiotransferase [Bacteroidales bacterium]|nr:MiaB/RimO family radical SAM methylthiotransferase [Bacteroidales bacterium]